MAIPAAKLPLAKGKLLCEPPNRCGRFGRALLEHGDRGVDRHDNQVRRLV